MLEIKKLVISMPYFGECFSANQNAGFQSHVPSGGCPYFTHKNMQDRLDKLCSAFAVALFNFHRFILMSSLKACRYMKLTETKLSIEFAPVETEEFFVFLSRIINSFRLVYVLLQMIVVSVAATQINDQVPQTICISLGSIHT